LERCCSGWLPTGPGALLVVAFAEGYKGQWDWEGAGSLVNGFITRAGSSPGYAGTRLARFAERVGDGRSMVQRIHPPFSVQIANGRGFLGEDLSFVS
jgi:hypothetical protein